MIPFRGIYNQILCMLHLCFPLIVIIMLFQCMFAPDTGQISSLKEVAGGTDHMMFSSGRIIS